MCKKYSERTYKLGIILITLCFASINVNSQDTLFKWTNDLEKQFLKNRQDSITWDKELFQRDMTDSLSNSKGRPFPHGAFPVPAYDLAGKFRYHGAGAGANFKNYHDKTLVYSFFYAGKTEQSKSFLGGKENEVFFMFVMLTDFIDTVNYSNASAYILSRNNPDVTCEGYFKTRSDEIDYTAFLTAARDEYAIVNMRLFNLKFGRLILIAPQKDRSLRSLQLMMPILSNTEIDDYLNRTLKQKDVMEFLLAENNL